MNAPLQRQTATTDLLSLRVQGHAIAPQPRIVALTSKNLADHDSTLTATANAIRFLNVPNTPKQDTPPELRAYNTARSDERLRELESPPADETSPRLVTLKIEWSKT